MASFICHAIDVAKQVRLERIVRPRLETRASPRTADEDYSKQCQDQARQQIAGGKQEPNERRELLMAEDANYTDQRQSHESEQHVSLGRSAVELVELRQH